MAIKNHYPHRPINFPDLPQPLGVETAKVRLILSGEPSQIPEQIAAMIDTRVGFHSMIGQFPSHPIFPGDVSDTERFGVSCPG
jgi:hypothetical protein